jgi:hypothetical protein
MEPKNSGGQTREFIVKYETLAESMLLPIKSLLAKVHRGRYRGIANLPAELEKPCFYEGGLPHGRRLN